MTERPLLILPEPQILERDKKSGNLILQSYHIPGFERQRDRLTPKFESMLESFITDTPDGIEPEYVLVLETVGRIEDFQTAIRRIDGLEWLAEFDDELKADEDYYQKFKVGNQFFSDKIETINTKQSKQIWNVLRNNDFIDKDKYITEKSIELISEKLPGEFSHLSNDIINLLRKGKAEKKTKGLGGRFFLSMSNRQGMEEMLRLWKKWDGTKESLKRPV